ncbi:hypothetical protein [Nitrosomonas mobilis]|uniref:Uncharacterized protein n=1 Tax=Nitrosomonas mobilis TaxID=51642 RepID=A0A1G5SCE5_9PROT|nr:hypothetical protein [Nitrosomonas mobilis]SCZ84788.1 hypothetical protein NSMM_260084 [Nitrosomonas mobilis]
MQSVIQFYSEKLEAKKIVVSMIEISALMIAYPTWSANNIHNLHTFT